ncbi:apolipoprotein N-acyltransferase [Marinobacterium sp. MBR-111]
MVDVFYKSLFVIVAGASTALAFSPFNLFLLSLVGPVVLYFVTRDTATRVVVLFFGLFSVSFYLSGAHWIFIPLIKKSNSNFISLLLFTLFIAVLVLHFSFFGYIYSVLSRLFRFYPILFGLAWGGIELSREFIFSGFPWLSIGFSWVDSPFSSLLGFLGVWGVSVFLVVFSVFTINCLVHGNIVQAAWAGMIFIIIYSVSELSISRIYYDQKIKVAMIQPGILSDEKDDNRFYERTHDLIMRSEEFIGFDIIVWPETALPRYGKVRSLMDPFRKTLNSNRTALLSGFVYRGNVGFETVSHNSIGLFSMGDSVYHKVKLIEIFEKKPKNQLIKNWLKSFGFNNDFRKSDTNIEYFNVAGLNIAPFICYEIAFTIYSHDAYSESDLIVNVVNDGWFNNTIEPYQHLQIARARALESGRWIIRSANDGVSAFIEPNGNIYASLGRDHPGALMADIHLYRDNNLYSTFGFLNILLVLVFFVFIIWFFKLE